MPDYLDWFVNREKQFQGFQKLVARETPKTVMLIEDQPEMGKTWVIQKMRHHCSKDTVPAMFVDFRDRRPHDYLSLVRLARDQIGPEFFNELTATINRFTSVNITFNNTAAAGVSVAAQGEGTVRVQGDIAGGDLIKDNQFYIQGESEVARRAAEIQINDVFFACLTNVLAQTSVVFLFDSYEDVTVEAERWLRDYLLLKVGEGQLDNAIIIIAGRKTPDLGTMLKPLIAKTNLDRFNEEHVREYIEERRQIEGLDVPTIFKTSGGNPGLLAKMADVAAMSTQSNDDWL